MKRLYRSRDDRMIAGVAGGLAEYFGIDSTIVRLVWVLLLLPGGLPGLLPYIICWIIIPEEPVGIEAQPMIEQTSRTTTAPATPPTTAPSTTPSMMTTPATSETTETRSTPLSPSDVTATPPSTGERRSDEDEDRPTPPPAH